MTSFDLSYDVVIVGAGPAGLGAAIRLKQLKPEIDVCVLEKGPEVGTHLISGALFPQGLCHTIFPDQQWKNSPPSGTPVSFHQWMWLTKNNAILLDQRLIPPMLVLSTPLEIHSLGNYCCWLAEEANALGVDIFPCMPVQQGLYSEQGDLIGVACVGSDEGDPGCCIAARYTLVAEGARGSLTRELEERYQLRHKPQQYALGFKARWVSDHPRWRTGEVIHTQGWPLLRRGGGGFLYASSETELHMGLVIPLNDKNAQFDPLERFNLWCAHDTIRAQLDGARRIGFGARVIAEGGWDALAKVIFPGGALIGCAAGVLDLRRQQGILPAIRSGQIAAQAIFNNQSDRNTTAPLLKEYESTLQQSEEVASLYDAAPIRATFSRFGSFVGMLGCALHYWLRELHVSVPYWSDPRADHQQIRINSVLHPHEQGNRTQLLFDAGIDARGITTLHLKFKGHSPASECHSPLSQSVLHHSCPAGVYRIENGHFSVQPENCLHCKCCDVREPQQQLRWTTPQGGSGPRYQGL